LGVEARLLVEAGRAALRPASSDRLRIHDALHAKILGAERLNTSWRASPFFGWPALLSSTAGAMLIGGIALYTFRPEAQRVARPHPAVIRRQQPPAPAAPPVRDAPVLSAPEPAVAPRVTAPAAARAPAALRPSDQLAEEVRILSRAETELHAGRFAPALRLLDEHRRRFPRGALVEERLGARARVLCALGRAPEATNELRQLAPGSLHEDRARESCAEAARAR
jgi:hypothetical protein